MEKMEKKAERIETIDYLKGLGVLWFTMGHMMLYYQDGTWEPFMSVTILSLDWLTVSLFVTLTVLGTMISIRKKQRSGKTKGMFKDAIIKSIYLLIVGEILNVFVELLYGYHAGFWHVFGANMITDVALAQLFTYGLMKLNMKARMSLSIVLMVLYHVIFSLLLSFIGYHGGHIEVNSEFLGQYGVAGIMYFLLFHMDAMSPHFSWILCAVLSSMMFDAFVNRHTKSRFSVFQKTEASSNLIIKGGILIVFSILAGGFILFQGVGASRWLYEYLVDGGFFKEINLQGLPLVLVRHVPQYIMLNLGVLATCFGFLYWREKVQEKKLNLSSIISPLGRLSFSIFVYGHLLALIPWKLPLSLFLIRVIPIWLGIIIATKLWETYGKGIGSLEWGLSMYIKGIKFLVRKTHVKKDVQAPRQD